MIIETNSAKETFLSWGKAGQAGKGRTDLYLKWRFLGRKLCYRGVA